MACSRVIKVLVASGTLALAASMTASSALSLTAELAKKCREVMVKAYPPLPAGSSQAEREYFRACVAQDGKIDGVETSTNGRAKK